MISLLISLCYAAQISSHPSCVWFVRSRHMRNLNQSGKANQAVWESMSRGNSSLRSSKPPKPSLNRGYGIESDLLMLFHDVTDTLRSTSIDDDMLVGSTKTAKSRPMIEKKRKESKTKGKKKVNRVITRRLQSFEQKDLDHSIVFEEQAATKIRAAPMVLDQTAEVNDDRESFTVSEGVAFADWAAAIVDEEMDVLLVPPPCSRRNHSIGLGPVVVPKVEYRQVVPKVEYLQEKTEAVRKVEDLQKSPPKRALPNDKTELFSMVEDLRKYHLEGTFRKDKLCLLKPVSLQEEIEFLKALIEETPECVFIRPWIGSLGTFFNPTQSHTTQHEPRGSPPARQCHRGAGFKEAPEVVFIDAFVKEVRAYADLMKNLVNCNSKQHQPP